ncbi:MAG TPA: hypothetical protein VF556_01465 [Pyrinomonadaceae bacterium]
MKKVFETILIASTTATMTFLFIVAFSVTQTFAQGITVYNSIPSNLPGNVISQPFQAQQASEFGDRVQFSAGSGRNLLTVKQIMSSWGCESGAWYSGDCITTPGATFSHPITLNIYNVGTGSTVGSLIGSVTQTFAIPYRPSADNVNCTGGRWYDGTNCYNGYATPITFNLGGLTVPNEVIYGIAFNTSNYGTAPIGPSACSETAAGCGYDSLNVGLDGATPPLVGVNPDPNDAYLNTLTAGWYCDLGAGGIGTFRRDSGCWTEYQPSVKFTAANAPTNADQCKNGGWQVRTRPDGSLFKNQGDCVQYVNTKK